MERATYVAGGRDHVHVLENIVNFKQVTSSLLPLPCKPLIKCWVKVRWNYGIRAKGNLSLRIFTGMNGKWKLDNAGERNTILEDKENS